MNIHYSNTYISQIRKIARGLSKKRGSILVTGASGLIGSCMIDVLLIANKEFDSNYKIYALGRSEEKLKRRFEYGLDDIELIVQDIITPINIDYDFDYIIHAASNADPKSYACYPVETVLTNIEGAKNVLNYCKQHINTKVMLMSTFEVYGRHEADEYSENDYGYLDQNVIRSGYPESKRIAEILFRSYHEEYGVDGVIARLSSIYGPTMLKDDSKAHAQFIRKGLSGEDIILKSEGLQLRTYCYVMDAVEGLFTVLFSGRSGEAYNVANKNSIATIAEVARSVAEICKTKIVFDLPDEIEKKGFSKPQNCVLTTKKIESLGWSAKYDLSSGLYSTLSILKEVEY